MIDNEFEDCTSVIPHPIFPDRYMKLPPSGKLEWLGGNLGLDYPIAEEVADSTGMTSTINLHELLGRLDDFVGYRGNTPIKQNIIQRAFVAYEHNLMTTDERSVFEQFVRDTLSSLSGLDAARQLVINNCNISLGG